MASSPRRWWRAWRAPPTPARPGNVDTAQLNEYLQKRVPELAKPFQRDQNPQFFKGRDAEVYTLAVLH